VRRPLHCLIVALLCLNLCVDSARACWHVRRRSQCCPAPSCSVPSCSAPSCGTWTVTTCAGDPAAWIHGPQEWAGHVVLTDCGPGVVVWADATQPAQCCVPDDVAYTVVAEHAIHDGIALDGVVVTQEVVDHVETQRVVTEEAVVHSPTIVLGTAPAAAGDQGPQTARPVAPQPQAASREPLPDLRPATAAAGTLPQADQPVPASLDLPEQTAAPKQDATAAQPLPAMPANPAVDDLAVAPDDTPREENLFDVFADDDAGEQAGPADEPEMTEERTTDGDDAEPAPAADDAPTPPAKDAPAEEAAGDAVEATAATSVPDEPLRRWTDATGDHHAQGWLVEIGADEAMILKVSGRHTTIALTDLSADDQAYVAAVAARLAAGRSAAAAANDTAGL